MLFAVLGTGKVIATAAWPKPLSEALKPLAWPLECIIKWINPHTRPGGNEGRKELEMKLYKVSYHVGNMPKGDYQYLLADSKEDAMSKTSLSPTLFDWEKPYLRWNCEIVK